MEDKITVNGLFKSELNPRLIDLASELKNYFNVKGNVEILILDGIPHKPNMFGGCSFSINWKLKPIYDNKFIIHRAVFERFNIETEFDEFRALAAHEFSHISHKDSIIWGFSSLLSMILEFIIFCISIVFLGSLSILIVIISGIVIVRYINYRTRLAEFRCDKDSVLFTKDPEVCQRALKKIHTEYNDIKDTIGFYHRVQLLLKKAFSIIFGDSHPTTDERIKNIYDLKQLIKK